MQALSRQTLLTCTHVVGPMTMFPLSFERTSIVRSPQPLLVVDLFPEMLDALLQLLGGLAADAWEQSTACPGWCVKDVALHLLGVEIGNLSRRRDGHAVTA